MEMIMKKRTSLRMDIIDKELDITLMELEKSTDIESEVISSLQLSDERIGDNFLMLMEYYSDLLIQCVKELRFEMAAKIKKIIELEYQLTMERVSIREEYNNLDSDLEDIIYIIYVNMNEYVEGEIEKIIYTL